MMQVAAILFATAFTFQVCWLTGKALLQLTGIRLFRSEGLLLGFVLGSACLSTLVFLLSIAGFARTWIFLIAGLALIGISLRWGATRPPTGAFPELPRLFLWPFAIILAMFTAVYLVNALAPEVSPDGSLFHVGLPALYLREHRIPAITTNMLASFSEGVEMLYLFAFSFGKQSATAMVHLLFTLMTALGILSYGRRIGYPIAGMVASLLFFASPVVGKLGSSAYLDVAVAAVLFTAFYLVQVWIDNGSENRLAMVPLGLVAGFGYAVKYTAFLSLAYVIGAVALRLIRLKRPVWKPCAMVIACALLMCAPWMLKDAIVYGNPVAPLGNLVFPSPYFYPSIEKDYQHGMASLGGADWRTWALEVTVKGMRLQGILGPVFLLAPLALAAAFTSAGRRLLCATLIFLAPYPFAVATRFLVPALPFVSLALGIALTRWRIVGAVVVLFHVASSWPETVSKYAPGAWRLRHLSVRAALRLIPEENFVRREMDDFAIGKVLDANVPPRDRVFSFSGFQSSYHSRQVVVEWQSSFGVRMGDALRGAIDRDWRSGRRLDGSFPGRMFRKIRLIRKVQTNVDWTVGEMRFFQDETELPRTSAWRLRASVNPWDVQLGFDNNPLTRWNSRGYRAASMFMEVDFNTIESFDRVRVECTPDQEPSLLSLAAETGPDHWEPVETHFIETPAHPPARLRRAAVEYLEQNGIHWLVIHDGDLLARDILTRQPQWGMHLAGAAPPYRLYRLD